MIRPSTPEDWNALVDVYDHSKPDELRAAGLDVVFVSLRDDKTAIELLTDVKIIVYENEQGRVVGFGGYNADYIGWLFVHHDARKQGVGRALLREMIRSCTGDPWLWLLPGNQAAYRLYTSEGFRLRDGARIKIHGVETTALRMVLG